MLPISYSREKCKLQTKLTRLIKATTPKISKEFWKMFKGEQVKVAPDDFTSSFQDWCLQIEKDEYVIVQETPKTDPIVNAFPELNEPISSKEIIDAVKSLKNEKSSGCVNIINEMLIADVLTLEPVSNVSFNAIFDLGYYTANWKLGINVLLFKRRDKMDQQHFRGITLLSCLAKLFSRTLNNRLHRWSEDNSVISNAQYAVVLLMQYMFKKYR